jgi:hypothetical protein
MPVVKTASAAQRQRKIMRSVRAEVDEPDGKPEANTEAEIKKEIEALDGKEGSDIAEKRRALYDKLEKIQGKDKQKAKAKANRTMAKTKVSKHQALSKVSVLAAVRSMAAMEMSEASSSVEEVISILSERLKTLGVAKQFESKMFGSSSIVAMTRHANGETFVFRMILKANGFQKRLSTPSVITYVRSATAEDGSLVQIEVTMVASHPDVVIINVNK